MFTGNNWILLVCLILVVLAFIALVVYACIFLVTASKSLKKIQEDLSKIGEQSTNILNHTDDIVGGFAPYGTLLGSFGKKIQKGLATTKKARPSRFVAEEEEYEEEEDEEELNGTGRTIMDVAHWVQLGVSIWKNLKFRR